MAELVLGCDEASASNEAPVVPVICCRRSHTAAQSTCTSHSGSGMYFAETATQEESRLSSGSSLRC